MRQTLLSFVLVAGTSALMAQTRYLQPVFDGVDVSARIQYQNNVSVLPAILSGGTKPPSQVPDFFQAYSPKGDLETKRPAVIIHTTGSYFPQFVGGGIFGTLNDSAAVNTAKRFARMGYVAVVATYRQGWNATSPDVNTRTGQLLIASYRGIQDLRSMTRFLRLNATTYRIDPDAIMAMGFGTGAYNVYNSNFLDDAAEVNKLPKFINTATGNPFLIDSLYGDPDGLKAGRINIPQNVGAESRVQFSAGIGGAMGDTTWIENDPTESPTVGLHFVNDANAPFAVGDVFVPVSPTTSLFVIRVDGPRSTIDRANRLGVNDELKEVNAALSELNDFTTVRSKALRNVPFTTRDQVRTTFAVENLYPFVRDLNTSIANTYNYIDSTTLAAFVAGYDNATNTKGATAAERLALERRNNPNVTNPVRANLVLDTIMAFVTPRAFIALGLGDVDAVRKVVGVVDIAAADIDFRVYPNPANEFATIQVGSDVELQFVALYDAQGRRVAAATVTGNQYGMNTANLPVGMYRLLAQTSEGAVAYPMMVAR